VEAVLLLAMGAGTCTGRVGEGQPWLRRCQKEGTEGEEGTRRRHHGSGEQGRGGVASDKKRERRCAQFL
jgi:hypothetical protein